MDFVNCTYESHSIEILEILNEVILNSTALYDYAPRTMESMTSWFSNKEKGNRWVNKAFGGFALSPFSSEYLELNWDE